MLLKGGIEESRLALRIEATGKRTRLSEKMIEVVRAGNYDTIMLGKHRLNKSREFLFGSVAVRLVRECLSNVLTVRVPEQSAAKGDKQGEAG